MSLYIVLLFQLFLALGTNAMNLYAWGVNDYGQLGLNNTYTRTPTLISTYTSKSITDLKASGTYHMATTANGDVFVSGNNWYGALAFPTSQRIYVTFPTLNPTLAGCNIFLGKRHGNAICGNTFYGWGVQAGYVAGIDQGNYGKKFQSLTQYQISATDIDTVITGSHFTFVKFKNGTIVCAGSGENGVLGLGDTKDRVTFDRFDFFDTIPLLKIFPSHAEHVCAISQSYSLYCWGSNAVGQLGLGDTEDRTRPALVSFFEQEYYIVQACVGLYHTIALTAGGKVFTWGLAQDGALGNGAWNNATYSTPIELTTLSDKNIVEVTCGLNFNFARTSTNTWYSWGAGSGGVLGTQTDQDVYTPTLVAFLSTFDITAILTASTSRSVYGWLDPAAPTNISGPPLVDECAQPGVITCSANAHCVDTDKNATCACDSGYTGDPDNCIDINECETLVCVSVATCTNLPGSYNCTCPSNLPIGDGQSSGSGCKARPPATTASTTTASTTTSSSSTTDANSGFPNITLSTSTSTSSSSSSTSVSVSSSSSSSSASPTTSGGDDNNNNNSNTNNGGTTTIGNTVTTGDGQSGIPVSTTTRRTNYYQTLAGTKDELSLEADDASESSQGDNLQDGTAAKQSKNKDKEIMIIVLIVFAALVAIALIAALAVFIKSSRRM